MDRRRFIRLAAVTAACPFLRPSVPPRSLSTGFPNIDRALFGGLHPGRLYLVAGCQIVGKTSFALNVARSISRIGHRLAYYGDDWELSRSRLPQDACIALPERTSVHEIREDLRQRASGAGLDLVVIDYVQRLHPHARLGSGPVPKDIEDLRSLAQALSIPVLALTQIWWSPEAVNTRESEILDLATRGAVDAAILLRRPWLSSGLLRPTAEVEIATRTARHTGIWLPEWATKPIHVIAKPLSTGSVDVDDVLSAGLRLGCVYVLGSGNCVGKTSFAFNIARRTERMDCRVAYYGLAHELHRSGLSRNACIPFPEWPSAHEICDDLEKRASTGGVGLAVIDHVQLLRRDTVRSEPVPFLQDLEVFADLARRRAICILVLTQARDRWEQEILGLAAEEPVETVILLRRPWLADGVMRPETEVEVATRTARHTGIRLPAWATRPGPA